MKKRDLIELAKELAKDSLRNEKIKRLEELFDEIGDPWECKSEEENEDAYVTCKFCESEEPNHAGDCVYEKASELLSEKRVPEYRLKNLEQRIEWLEGKTDIEVELDYVPYFNPRVPVNAIVGMILKYFNIQLAFDRVGSAWLIGNKE
jgi:hypothetical protein